MSVLWSKTIDELIARKPQTSAALREIGEFQIRFGFL
jgi:hypothetical protein